MEAMIGAGAAKPAKNPLLSHVSGDHGTTPELCEMTRYVLGSIELDPFSSDYWNHHVVKAERFYDARVDGYTQQWRARTAQVNPPGSEDGDRESRRNVPRAWEKLIGHYTAGEVDSAVWIGFALGQVCTLQNAPMHPLQFVTAFLLKRTEFMKRPESGSGPPIPNSSPTHANFVTLLPSRSNRELAGEQMRRFRERIGALSIGGALVRPL